MKKILKTLLPGLALFLMASCDKYEGPDPLDEPPASMNLTSWVYVVKDSVPITMVGEDGEEMTHNVDRTITNYLMFKSETVGTNKAEIVSKMHPSLNHDSIVDFKYDYHSPSGVIYYEGKDAHGNIVWIEAAFQVNGRKLSVNWGAGAVVYDRRLDL